MSHAHGTPKLQKPARTSFRGYSLDPEELPVTQQLAMIGSDGIVLASDRCVTIRDGRRRHEMETKIFFDQARGIATCWAKNKMPSANVARAILEEMKDEEFVNPIPKIKEIAERLYDANRSPYGDEMKGEVMFLTSKNLKTITQLHMEAGNYQAAFNFSRHIGGDTENPAICFADLFHNERLPVAELIPLAAYVVVKAASESKGIRGLDLLLCTKDGVKLLEEEQIEEHAARAREIDAEITRLFFPRATTK
jgi:hypothetical protein